MKPYSILLALGLLSLLQISSANAGWTLVDDFNRADSSTLGTAANSQSWTDSTGVAGVSGNVAQVTNDGGAIAVNMGNTIANDTTGTTFFQFRYTNTLEFKMGFLHYSGGISNPNRATTIVAEWDAPSSEIARGAYGGGDPGTNSVALTQNTWYSVWMVANNTTDQVTYYLSTGTSDASTANLFTTNISGDFRNTISGTIDLFGFDPFSGYANGALVEIDNIYVDNTGENLSLPVTEHTDGGGGTPDPDPEGLVLEPGVVIEGATPSTWTLDLRGLSDAEAQAAAAELSSRIYGTGLPQQSPLTIKTDYGLAKYLGFHVDSVDSNGATLRIRRDDGSSTLLSWPPSSAPHEVGRTYFLPLPSGEREITWEVMSAGTVLIDAYVIADSPNAFSDNPIPLTMREINGTLHNTKADGYKGIWYALQSGGFDEDYGYKYSGGLGTYPANQVPMVLYSEVANKTFFVYGGAPAANTAELLIMAGEYDHTTGQVSRPTIMDVKPGVDDPHDNPALSIDVTGYLWVFVSGRSGYRDGVLLRSTSPYSTAEFEEIMPLARATYPQPWYHPDHGFLFLNTIYSGGRTPRYSTSPDGFDWSGSQTLASLGGSYQVSGLHRNSGRIGTFFNWLPNNKVNERTNLYYLQTDNFGQTWTTADGAAVNIPVSQVQNPALVFDYANQGLLQYPCDLNFDENGNPLLLYITAPEGSYKPGPLSAGQRLWKVAHFDGTQWSEHSITSADNNYDMGSIYVEGDRWTVIAPFQPGPQPWTPGGEIAVWTSEDQGQSWTERREVTRDSTRNHTYIRRPQPYHPDFAAFWADGNPMETSESRLYFGNADGTRVWELPNDMSTSFQVPLEIDPPRGRWQQKNFTPEQLLDENISGWNSDPDEDAHWNLVEYALGMDPHAVSLTDIELVHVFLEGRTHPGIRYTRSVDAADVKISPQFSTDLEHWESGPNVMTLADRQYVVVDGVEKVEEIYCVTESFMDSEKGFFRLFVSFL
jgi:hypothetical protein